MNPLLMLLLLLTKLSPTDQQRALAIHNEARDAVGVPPLSWSNQLAADAQAYAETLARTRSFHHAKCNDGENLYWYSASTATPGEDASLSWLEERADYRHGRGWHRNFSEVGHYTQMIWKDTEQVGIGTAVASDGSTYVVARYHPAGNYTNQLPY